MTENRNIVLVTYDSLRADHCGFMGYPRDTTPTMDLLAKEGLVFENAVASGVPTIASMTAVMTGRHSQASPEIGFNTQQREQVTSRPTLAEVLSREGYVTGGLSPNPPASSYFGFDQGFDWFEDFLAEDRGVFERLWNRIFQRSIEGGSVATYLRLARNVLKREEVLRPWEAFYDRIRRWRESVDEPYFLWVLLLEPHHPWFPPKRAQRWSSSTDKYRSFRYYWEMLNSDWRPEFGPGTRARLENLYDDSIRYGDQFLNRLRGDFKDDEPVIIIHADHGEEFGEHGRYGHQPYLTKELVHVPLIVSGLDGVEPNRVSKPVGLRDLPATIAEIADVPHPFGTHSLLAADRQRPWATAKVFTEEERRLAIWVHGLRYLKQDGGIEVNGVEEGQMEQDVRTILDQMSGEESRIESHLTAIDHGVNAVIEEGRV